MLLHKHGYHHAQKKFLTFTLPTATKVMAAQNLNGEKNQYLCPKTFLLKVIQIKEQSSIQIKELKQRFKERSYIQPGNISILLSHPTKVIEHGYVSYL